MNDQIKEYLLYIGIALCIGYVVFAPSKDTIPKVTPPSMLEFDEHPIVAWTAYDRKGGPCVKIRYKIQRDNTRLYMFDDNGKLVHQTPLALDKFRELYNKGIGTDDAEFVLKELIELINDFIFTSLFFIMYIV